MASDTGHPRDPKSDAWHEAISLFTGYEAPKVDTLFDKLVGNDDIPMMKVEITKQKTVTYVDPDDFNWMSENAGFRIENTDFIIPFYTTGAGDTESKSEASGEEVSYYKARITLLGDKQAGAPPKGGEVHGYEGKSRYDNDFKKSDDGTVWDTRPLDQWAYGTGNALRELLAKPEGTKNFSWDGIGVAPEGVVSLGSFETVAQAFDRVQAFFDHQSDVLGNWQNLVGTEENEKWKGQAAGIFWDLIHQLKRKYDRIAKDMTNTEGKSYGSKQGAAVRAAGETFRLEAQKLYNSWELWQEAMGNPLRWLVDLLAEINQSNWNLNISQIEYDVDYGPYYASESYTASPYFEQEAKDASGKAYGSMTETSTWKKIGEAAVQRWWDSAYRDLVEPADTAMKNVGNAWSSSQFDLGKIKSTVGNSLKADYLEDKAAVDKAKAEADAAKAKADAEAKEKELEAKQAAWEEEQRKKQAEAEAKAEALEKEREAKEKELEAKQEAKEAAAEAKAEQKEKEQEAKQAALLAAQEQKEKEQEAKQEAKEKEQAAKQAEMEAKQEQKEKEQEAKQEAKEKEQEAKQAEMEAKQEQRQAEQQAKQEQLQQEQEKKQEEIQAKQEEKQAEAEAKQQAYQQQQQQMQLRTLNQQKTEQQQAKKEQEKAQAEQQAKQEQLQQEQEKKQEEQQAKQEAKQAELEAKQEAKEKEQEAKQEEQQKKQEQLQREQQQKQEELQEKQEQKQQEQEAKQEKAQEKQQQLQAQQVERQEQLQRDQMDRQEQAQEKQEQLQEKQQAKQEQLQQEQQEKQEKIQQQFQGRQNSVSDLVNNQLSGQLNAGDLPQGLSDLIGGPVNGDDSLTNPGGSTSHLDSHGRVVTDFPDGSHTTIDPTTQTSSLTRPDGTTISGPLNAGDVFTNPDGSVTHLDSQGQVVTEYPGGSTTSVDPHTGATAITGADGTTTTGYLNEGGLPQHTGQGGSLPGGGGSSGSLNGGTAPGSGLGSGLGTDLGSGYGSGYEEELYDDKPYDGTPATLSGATNGAAGAGAGGTPGGGTPLNPGPMPGMGGAGAGAGGGGGGQGTGERVRNVIDSGDPVSNRRRPSNARSRSGAYDEREATINTSSGSPFVPPMGAGAPGGGAGRVETESGDRTRDSWVEEEEDVWGSDEGGAPAVIGR